MIRLHRSTEHRAYALWACPRAAINSQRPPPAATCEHEAGAGLQPASNAENTLVMRRSVLTLAAVMPLVSRRCRVERPVDQGGALRARPWPWKASCFIVPRSAAPNLDPTSTRMGIGAYAEDGPEWPAQWSQASMSDGASCAARWW